MNLSKLCTPAMLYLVLSAIALVIGVFQKFEFFSLLVNVLFIGAWTWFLNLLCSKGYTPISWFLVLLPYLIMLVMFVMALEVVKTAKTTPPSAIQKNIHQRTLDAMSTMSGTRTNSM